MKERRSEGGKAAKAAHWAWARTLAFLLGKRQATRNPEHPSGVAAGDPYDVLRNYWYKFLCKRNVSEMTWSVDVMPYGEVLLEPDFGIKP